MSQNIADILNGKDDVAPQATEAPNSVEPVEAPTDTTEDAPVEPDEPESDSADDTGEVEAVAAPENKHTVPVRAMLAEREKRQEAQRKADALETRLRELETRIAQPPTPPKETPKDDLDDSDSVYSDIPGALRKMRDGLKNEFRTQQVTERYEISEEFAAEQYEDYTAVRDNFLEMSKAGNPEAIAIARAMHQSKMPAVAMYKAMQKRAEEQRWHDPAFREAQIAEEINKRVQAEIEKLRGEFEERPELPANKPVSSLAATRNVGSKSVVPVGRQSVRDILGR